MVVLTAMVDCTCDESTLQKLLDNMNEPRGRFEGLDGLELVQRLRPDVQFYIGFFWQIRGCKT